MSRKAEIERETKETRIKVVVDLDGRGDADIDTGIGFLDHLLSALVKHARLDVARLSEPEYAHQSRW